MDLFNHIQIWVSFIKYVDELCRWLMVFGCKKPCKDFTHKKNAVLGKGLAWAGEMKKVCMFFLLLFMGLCWLDTVCFPKPSCASMVILWKINHSALCTKCLFHPHCDPVSQWPPCCHVKLSIAFLLVVVDWWKTKAAIMNS